MLEAKRGAKVQHFFIYEGFLAFKLSIFTEILTKLNMFRIHMRIFRIMRLKKWYFLLNLVKIQILSYKIS